jgi:hypothetical protein
MQIENKSTVHPFAIEKMISRDPINPTLKSGGP